MGRGSLDGNTKDTEGGVSDTFMVGTERQVVSGVTRGARMHFSGKARFPKDQGGVFIVSVGSGRQQFARSV
jgi:hypothetical protein